MAGVYGVTTKLGIDSASPVTKAFNFVSDTLALTEELVQTAGNIGTRRAPSERVRAGNQRVAGSITLQPNPIELNELLPWILGGTPAVGTPAGKTTFPVADTLPTRFVTSDRGAKVFTYAGVGVTRATFRSTQGGPLTLTLDLIGQTETVGDAGTFPALNVDLAQNTFMHADLVLTINAVAHKCPDFELVVDNAIDADRFFNSQTLVSVQPTDRQILLNTSLPYGDSSAAYNLSSAGVAASAVFTNGTLDLTFTLARLQVPRQSPPIQGRNEIFLPINAVGRALGATPGTTDDLSVVLDLTA